MRIHILGSTVSFDARQQTPPASFVAAQATGGAAVLVQFRLDVQATTDLPNLVDEDGRLSATITVDTTDIGFELENISDRDELQIQLVTPTQVTVRVLHAVGRTTTAALCVARCYDGSEGQPCVTCIRDGRSAVICC